MKEFIAGIYQNQGSYKSFQPNFIHREWSIDDMSIIQLLSEADRMIGRLDMYSEYIPNINLFMRMHILKEATESSRIEGTQTNIEEALLDKNDVQIDRREDWEEVHNYIKALNYAINRLNELPLSTRLIKEIHYILLQGVRGKHKLPGEFRSSQNWIGGASLRDAIFIPPNYHSINDLMSDLEKFIHSESVLLPDLLKIALVHYQFETIHPFLDGNGRVGRLMIALYLVEKGILKQPVLYLSSFFEKHRQLYYDNLMNVRLKNDISQWFKFFLVSIIETAKQGVNTFDAILKLKKEKEELIQQQSKRVPHLLIILTYLYEQPLINVDKVMELTGKTLPTAHKIIQEMIGFGILKEVSSTKSDKMYIFYAYTSLF